MTDLDSPAVDDIHAVDVSVLSGAAAEPDASAAAEPSGGRSALLAGLAALLTTIGLALIVGLEGQLRWLGAIPGALALLAILASRPDTTTGGGDAAARAGGGPPSVPGVELRSVSTIDPVRIADHLVGPYDGPTTGLPSAQIVIARVDANEADRLRQIPAECAQRWSPADLQMVLIAIPRAPPDVVADIGDAYDATLVVNQPGDVAALMNYLPDVLAQPESEDITGIGSVTIRRTPIEDRLPSNPGLQRDISAGRGKPLSAVAQAHRNEMGRPPTRTVLAAPPDYLQAATQALQPCLTPPLTVQHEAPEVDIVRFHMDQVLPELPDAATWRRDSVRDEGAPATGHRPVVDSTAPDDDAPQVSRSLDPAR